MAILDDVKTALRITHNKLDSDITAKISSARAEMVRVGVDSTKAASDSDALVTEAIKTYVQYKYTDDSKAMENYYNSWVVQVDGLRKSSDYMRDDDE